nr:hypothetical protein [Oceanococcus sp. HetDA_MAG_MS8]
MSHTAHPCATAREHGLITLGQTLTVGKGQHGHGIQQAGDPDASRTLRAEWMRK